MLNKLNLSNNKIKSVTNTIAKMEYLWELDIGNNEFQTFQRLPSTIRKWYERYYHSNSIDNSRAPPLKEVVALVRYL